MVSAHSSARGRFRQTGLASSRKLLRAAVAHRRWSAESDTGQTGTPGRATVGCSGNTNLPEPRAAPANPKARGVFLRNA
jgi:hypothetical protein